MMLLLRNIPEMGSLYGRINIDRKYNAMIVATLEIPILKI